MIEKFIKIENVGKFKTFYAKGDVSFGALTLVYGANARGKTTLCAILRSLQSGDPALVLERKTLGSTAPAQVQLALGGKIIAFDGAGWPGAHSDLAVFDSAFIHENVYLGDEIGYEQRKNLYRVVVGAEGVRLAREIEELNKAGREDNKELSSSNELLAKELCDGVAFEDFLSWSTSDGLEEQIKSLKSAISKARITQEKAREIAEKHLLSKVALPVLPEEFLPVLAKEFAHAADAAEVLVKEQMAARQMERAGEAWLSQGLHFLAGDSCPFCRQNICGNDLIAAYKAHFDGSYRQLKQEVEALKQKILSSVGEAAVGDALQTLASNLALLEFWKQFQPVALPDIPIGEIKDKFARLRALALGLAERKQQAPLAAVMPGADFTAALHDVLALQSAVDRYNAAIDSGNLCISQMKAAGKLESDIGALERELRLLECRKRRFLPAVEQACKDYQERLAAKAAIERDKKAVKVQLDRYCDQMLEKFERSINHYLERFNADFSLSNSKHRYTGGSPSSIFQIAIEKHAVELGSAKTTTGIPSFKTTLSAGDRSILALAFFFAALQHDSSLKDKIVVLDDPFIGQDLSRRISTSQLIRSLAGRAKQVIVLSHDPHFLQLIGEGHFPKEVKALQLCKTDAGSIISTFDLEAETCSAYLNDYHTLRQYSYDKKGDPRSVVRSIRPFIEAWLRASHPGRFRPEQRLGEYIAQVEEAADHDDIAPLKAALSEIKALHDYSKRYHHGADSTEDISEEELYGFVKRTLCLCGRYER